MTDKGRNASFRRSAIVKKLVRQALKPLMGLPSRHIGRSGNLLLAQFGNLNQVSAHDGSTKTVYEWSLQIQCPWRISQGTRIVIAYRDFYYSDAPLKNLDVVTKRSSNSILETLCAEFSSNPPRVQSIDADDSGDFILCLTAGYSIEVFPSESMESGKHWRVFEPGGQGKSFVFPPGD